MRTTDYDRWLTTNYREEAAEAKQDAFERWAEAEMPDLDWDDHDEVANAEAEFDQAMDDLWESRAIDAAEARAEARWEREMDRY